MSLSDKSFVAIAEISSDGRFAKGVFMVSRSLPFALLLVLITSTLSLAQTHPNRIVLAYSASWRDTESPPRYYNYAAITHLARSFLEPHADGSITVPPGFFEPEMEKLAHAAGVKLLVSLGGAADDNKRWVSLASNPQNLDRFCTQLHQLLSDHAYDGIDIDWEPSPLNDSDAAAYATLITALRARMPGIVLTTALPASDYWIGHMQWDKVLPALDYINVMTYDYAGAWGGIAAHGSNLYPPSAYPRQPEYSADEGMRNLFDKHHVPKSKLLLGMNFWGYRFATPKLGDSFPTNAKGFADSITYADTSTLLRSGHYQSFWDEGAKMPYLQRLSGAMTISYENPESVRRKCEYAKDHDLAGVMIWHIGADEDGDTAPLLDAVGQSFGAPALLQPVSALIQTNERLSNAAPNGGSVSSPDRESARATYRANMDRTAASEDAKWMAHPPTSRASQ